MSLHNNLHFFEGYYFKKTPSNFLQFLAINDRIYLMKIKA